MTRETPSRMLHDHDPRAHAQGHDRHDHTDTVPATSTAIDSSRRGVRPADRIADLWDRARDAMERPFARPWHADLCDYYRVSPAEALALGTRSSDRRPSLPSSATTHAVSGQTFDELWRARSRTNPASIHSFYQEIGAWAAFRQVVFHRQHSFRFVSRLIRPGDRFCEYGAGVAPISAWLLEHRSRMPFELTIADVPSEHLTFGKWRLDRRAAQLRSPATIRSIEIQPDRLPLEGAYDAIAILEVFEHLPNPLEVTAHLCDHLRPGGLLWENYINHPHQHDPHDHGADLPAAQEQRPAVLALLRERCDLVRDYDPAAPFEGGTRCWRRR